MDGVRLNKGSRSIFKLQLVRERDSDVEQKDTFKFDLLNVWTCY